MDPSGLSSVPASPNMLSGVTDWGRGWEISGGDLILYVSSNKNDGFKIRGTDPHAYTAMTLDSGAKGYGGGGAGSRSGAGSGNSGPREASNGFSPSEISTLTTVGSVFANGLEGRANENVNHKYKYGSNTHTAKELTDLNKARMNNIAKGANVLGRAVGVTGAAIAVYDEFENPTTANIIKASANVGLLFVRMNPVTYLPEQPHLS